MAARNTGSGFLRLLQRYTEKLSSRMSLLP
jgi:hypothetical protein